MYNVVVINNKTKVVTIMTANPLPHKEACTVLNKITKYKWRTETLQEVY